jgi:hypothetical protein
MRRNRASARAGSLALVALAWVPATAASQLGPDGSPITIASDYGSVSFGVGGWY